MKATKRVMLFTVALVLASAAAPAFGQSEMEIRNRALESFEEGMKLFEASKFARAVSVFEEALELFDSIGDVEGVARANNILGSVYEVQGEFDEAVGYYQKR